MLQHGCTAGLLDHVVGRVFQYYVVGAALYDGSCGNQRQLGFLLQFLYAERAAVAHGGFDFGQ